jgi:lipopolysaccharide export system protein LptC
MSYLKNDRLAIRFPLALLVLLAALTFWLDRKVHPPTPKRDGSSRHDPDYYIENFSATKMNANGNLRYILTAQRMVHYPDDDSTHLVSPNFKHVEEGKQPLEISADKGLISRDGEHAYFMNNVQVIRQASSDRGAITLNTSYLHIVPEEDYAQTDKAVTITDPNAVVSAVGMELNNKTRILKLKSQVKIRYTATNG